MQFSIKDEGIGMSVEDQEKVFDRHHRIKNQNMETISGFGYLKLKPFPPYFYGGNSEARISLVYLAGVLLILQLYWFQVEVKRLDSRKLIRAEHLIINSENGALFASTLTDSAFQRVEKPSSSCLKTASSI